MPGASRQGASNASTPTISHAPSHQRLECGPSTTELSECGIRTVHDFLVAHGGDYRTICNIFPDQTRAMEIAWIVNGVQGDGQHKYPHPLLVENLKSGSWKSLHAGLKSLMFDSVSSSALCHVLKSVVTPAFVGLCSE